MPYCPNRTALAALVAAVSLAGVAGAQPADAGVSRLADDASRCGPQIFACDTGIARATLTSQDCHSARGSYFDLYSFQAEPGEMITATVAGASFDGYIALVDPSGHIVAQHQAGRGEPAFLSHPAEAGGIYDLITSSVAADAQGAYDFAIACLPVEPAPATCSGDEDGLCLGDGRFQVDTWWQTADGTTGRGHGRQVSPDTGFFWFFQEGTAEVMVKTLDGCEVNGHNWVFTAGLTDVHTAMRVTDTHTATERWYFNPHRTGFRAVQDTTALATCR